MDDKYHLYSIPLQDQVTSVEKSRRLKKEGSPQSSIFYWGARKKNEKDPNNFWLERWDFEHGKPNKKYKTYFSAYLPGELERL